MAKIMTVFGASGNQGGSVISAVLADSEVSKEFRIRAVTRDRSKTSIKRWAGSGIEVVSADMSSVDSLANAIGGSHTVFLVTNFWDSMAAETEIDQGTNVADACKTAEVEHLIFSSLINTTNASKGRLPHISHFDGKAKIEEHIRGLGVPASFVLPGYYMSNFFDMIRKIEDGSYMLALPVSGGKAQLPLFDAAEDIGKFVVGMLKAHPSCVGQHIYAATAYYTPEQIMKEFGEVLDKQAMFMQVSAEAFKSFLPEMVAQELLENQLLVEDPGYYAGADLSESLTVVSGPLTSWTDFVKANREKWE